MNSQLILTKTDFILYQDAPRHLWAYKHGLVEKKDIDTYLEHLIEQGYDVERYAEMYIKDYLVPEYYSQGIQTESNDVLFQVTKVDDKFEARSDVIIKNPKTNKWDIYEIKSTTSIKRKHKFDVTFQSLVFEKHFEIGTVNILHLNKDYVRRGDLNLKLLFTSTDVTKDVAKLKDEVHNLRYQAIEDLMTDDFNEVLNCTKPKDCICPEICHKDTPQYSIYNIRNIGAKARKLEELNIKSVFDIPSEFELTEPQKLQVQVAKDNKTFIDAEAIKSRLNSLAYPLYFIDYETFNPAIPTYDGYKPYEHIPFQWSLHVIETPNSEAKHYEFIETEQIDPIPHFLSELRKVLKDTGSIIVWNKSFEGSKNEIMGRIYPEYALFCESMNTRIFDLMEIFQKQLYADPKFKGSYSIKKVLPVLVPELSYDDLEIGEGATAMVTWDKIFGNPLDLNGLPTTKEQVKDNLLRYCEQDTLAMVRIYEYLVANVI